MIKDFYLQMRREYHSTDSTPVTTRQLQSLIRLAEARAKAAMREDVTAADARDVVEIMRGALNDVYEDDIVDREEMREFKRLTAGVKGLASGACPKKKNWKKKLI